MIDNVFNLYTVQFTIYIVKYPHMKYSYVFYILDH